MPRIAPATMAWTTPTKTLLEILGALNEMGGTKILSVELFNPEYYKQDANKVATTALNKMKNLVAEAT